jgi:hypothetical protein
VPVGGRVRKADIQAKPESGRSDSPRRLPSTRSGWCESAQAL